LTYFKNEIEKYAIQIYGKRYDDSWPIARIWLYNDSEQSIGNVYFYRDGHTIPNNRSAELAGPKKADLTMHERQLDSVVDMLRNEKPCSVFYYNATYAGIYTGTEPVGEEESETEESINKAVPVGEIK